MYCQVCVRKKLQKRFARWVVVGTKGVRQGWKLDVCGIHVRKYRSQPERYEVQSGLLESLKEVIVPLTAIGILASIVARCAQNPDDWNVSAVTLPSEKEDQQ